MRSATRPRWKTSSAVPTGSRFFIFDPSAERKSKGAGGNEQAQGVFPQRCSRRSSGMSCIPRSRSCCGSRWYSAWGSSISSIRSRHRWLKLCGRRTECVFQRVRRAAPRHTFRESGLSPWPTELWIHTLWSFSPIPAERCRVHEHPGIEVMYVISGKVGVRIRPKRRELAPEIRFRSIRVWPTGSAAWGSALPRSWRRRSTGKLPPAVRTRSVRLGTGDWARIAWPRTTFDDIHD